MARYSIRRQLGRHHRLILASSLLLVPLMAVLTYQVLGNRRPPWNWSPWELVSVVAMWPLWLGVNLFSLWRLCTLDRHSDLQALARYGLVPDLVAEIETELADPTQVAQVGWVFRSFQLQDLQESGLVKPFQLYAGELGDTEVWLTPSWFIWVVVRGTRMHFFRMDSIVAVFRQGLAVVLIDQHGVRVTIPGTDAGVTRLLAEVLVRVPWALSHFDEKMEKTMKENPTQVIAEVEFRRQQIHQKTRMDNGSAS